MSCMQSIAVVPLFKMFRFTVTLLISLTVVDTMADGSCDRSLKVQIKNYIDNYAHGGSIGKTVIASVDPLFLDEAEFHCESSVVNMYINYKDAYVYGLSSMKVVDSSVDIKGPNVVLVAKTYIPELKMRGKYQGRGKVLHMNCDKSSGDSLTVFERVDAVQTLRGTVKSDGFLCVDDYTVTLHIQDIKFTYQNILGGGIPGLLAENMMRAKSQTILKKFEPDIAAVLAKNMKRFTSQIYSSAPWCELAPTGP